MRPWDGLKRSFIEQRERVSNALSDALVASGLNESAPSGSANGRREAVADARDERASTRAFGALRGARASVERAGDREACVTLYESFGGRYGATEDDEEQLSDASGRTLGETTRATLASVSGRVFVAMRVVGGDGRAKGRRVVTMCRGKTTTPVWRSTRDLRCEATTADALCVDVYSGTSVKGIEKATLIARGQISMAYALANEGMELAVPLHAKLERVASPGTVWVRVTRGASDGAPKRKKRIFFVRHGESKWNEAQRDINIASMMRFDHPLTLVGVQQAQALGGRGAIACSHAHAGILVHANVSSMSPPTMSPPSSPSSPSRTASPLRAASSSEHVHDAEGAELCVAYEQCSTCYVSPLTRAVQTSCLLLQSHSRAMSGTIRQVCLQSLREIKGVGGLDTVGIAQGEGILERARKKLAELINDHTASRLGAGIAFDPNDAVGQWWTSETDADNSQDVDERIFDFLETMRFDEDDAVIVVGHSLFLQQLVSRIVPSTDAVQSPSTIASESIAASNLLDGFSDPFAPKDPFASFTASNGGDGGIPFVPAQAPPRVPTIRASRKRQKIFGRLMNQKLCNAGCVALDVVFDASGRATLEDAQLIFGSKFVT